MSSDSEFDRDVRELRVLYHGVKEEVAVLREALRGEIANSRLMIKNLQESQDKTNKILSWFGALAGGTVVVAVINLALKGGTQ